MMETADHDSGRARSASVEPDTADGMATPEPDVAGDRALGAHAPALLAAEHWSLLWARSLIRKRVDQAYLVSENEVSPSWASANQAP
jgi:hypothetical protein